MADYKSSEGMVTYKCMNCSAEMSVSKRREMRMDGRSCFLCRGPIQAVDNPRSIGKITVDIDVSNALKGLKATQREAKKATAALKELEEQQKKYTSLGIPKELFPLVQSNDDWEKQYEVFERQFSICPECNSSNVKLEKLKADDKPVAFGACCLDCWWKHE